MGYGTSVFLQVVAVLLLQQSHTVTSDARPAAFLTCCTVSKVVNKDGVTVDTNFRCSHVNSACR